MRVPILPPPGLVSDHTDYAAPGVWASGSNVRFFHGLPQAIGGESSLQSGALETYNGASKLLAYTIAGVAHLAVRATSFLYSVNTTTWARTNITPASGWVAGRGASLAMFGDVLLAVPHDYSAPASSGTLFTSTAGAQAVAVAPAPDNISIMLVTPSRQVMALACNEETSGTYNGRCIRWSDIEDHTDWTTLSSNNAGEYILPGQENIVGARLVGDHIAVWTNSALWLGQYIGQPGQTFIFTRIDSVGLVGRDCHAEFQGTLYWMAPDLFVYAWSPGSLPTKIECPCLIDVWEEIGVDSGYPRVTDRFKFHAAALRKYGEIWFFYPALGNGVPNKYLVYCVNESSAAQRPVWFRGPMLAGAVIDDPLLIDALNMGDSTAIRIDSDPSSPLTVIDKTSDGPTYPSWNIQSSFYYIDEGKRRVQVQRYWDDTHGETATYRFTLQLRDNPGETAAARTSGPHTVTTGTTVKNDFRASGRLVAIKFENGTTPAKFRLGKPVVEAVPLGVR